MENRRNKKNAGSALVWAIVILLVLSIAITAILSVSLSYTRQSINNNAKQQAYFSARSVVTAIGGEICSGTTSGEALLVKLKALPDGGELKLDNFKFTRGGADAEMGKCVAVIEKTDENNMLIKATATLGNVSDTVELALTYKKGAGGFIGLVAEELGDKILQGGNMISGDVSLTTINTKNKDDAPIVYITGENMPLQSTAKMNLGGSLYVKSDVAISGGEHGNKNKFEAIYSDDNISVSGYYEVEKEVYSANGSCTIAAPPDSLKITPKFGESPPGVSKLPVLSPPDLPPMPGTAEEVTESNVPNFWGKPNFDTFYHITEEIKINNLKNQADSGNIYIYVDQNITFAVEKMQNKSEPNIYIILGGKGSTFILGKGNENKPTAFYGFIYGGEDTIVNFLDKATLYGAVQASKVNIANELTIDNSDISGGAGGWQFVNYSTGEEVTSS